MKPLNYDPDFEGILECINNLINKIYLDKYLPKCIKMYYAHVGMYSNTFRCGDEAYENYEGLLKNIIAFPYISNYKDHFFDFDYCSDSSSHLTREGALIHTEVLSSEILAQIEKDKNE